MIDFEAVDITQLASDIMRETALEREERKMSFHNLLPERIVVKGNRSLLYSIFRNLTDNAIAYAGEETTITLEGKEVGNKWHFIFRDNGQECLRSIWLASLSVSIVWTRGAAVRWEVQGWDLPS